MLRSRSSGCCEWPWWWAVLARVVRLMIEACMRQLAHIRPGGAVQVDPMKPKMKPPGTKRLKPKF